MSRKKKNPGRPAEQAWRNRIVGHGEEAADQLLANPRNWRVHPKQQQDALAGVLNEVGWVQDVVVNRRTGHVIDGHLRISLAISRGEKVPVVYVDLSEDEEAKILATIDPLSAMAATDQTLLDKLLGEVVTGDAAVQALLDSLKAPEASMPAAGEDDAPEAPAVPVSVLGDLWLCGEHRVLCGDSTSENAVSRLLGAGTGKRPFLMVTDPPYGVNYDPEWRLEAGIIKPWHRLAKGKVSNDDNPDWTNSYSLFPGDVAYVWHAGVFAAEVAMGILASCFEIRAQIIWRKQNFVFGRGSYHWQHEPCWYAVRKGKRSNWRGDRTQSTVWDVPNCHATQGNVDDCRTDHGTQKPVEVMRRPILNHTEPGDAVYDPFLGSGTTLIAAENTGRTCYGIDIDPKYVDVIVKRWQDFTGELATLDGDGRIFSEITKDRCPELQPA